MTDASDPRCYALLPCAGVGSRSGAAIPKQYVAIAGRAMVAHTLAALAGVARLAATLVVLAPDDELFEQHVPGFAGERGWVCRRGGAQRADTVAAGLADLLERGAREHDWVLVHDAARCLVRAEWVDRLIDACLADQVGGLLALPVADTLKRAEGGRVAQTLPRGDKWAAQTPQMFRIGMLRDALRHAGTAVTDDASAIEALGLRPLLVEGDAANLKVTWPSDFMLAERVLAARLQGDS
ncbi:MAG: 2-C-methyl-D-erythritol 4-phosphate cytidylyltransferase [Piscinibacter sp.]